MGTLLAAVLGAGRCSEVPASTCLTGVMTIENKQIQIDFSVDVNRPYREFSSLFASETLYKPRYEGKPTVIGHITKMEYTDISKKLFMPSCDSVFPSKTFENNRAMALKPDCLSIPFTVVGATKPMQISCDNCHFQQCDFIYNCNHRMFEGDLSFVMDDPDHDYIVEWSTSEDMTCR